VIESTRLSGAANGRVPVELGEWVSLLRRPDGCVNTRLFRPKAQTDSLTRTGRSPAVTIAWARPLCATRNAVQFATERVCDE